MRSVPLPEHGFDDGGGRYVQAGDDRHRLEDEGGDGRLLAGQLLHQLVKLTGVLLPLLFGSYSVIRIKCPKSYRKSVLHLLEYNANLYLSRFSTDLQ